jgi:predicted small secreted protein
LAGTDKRAALIVEENTMLKRFVATLIALSFAPMLLTACNTMQGAGQDVEKAGQKVQKEAQEHKKY